MPRLVMEKEPAFSIKTYLQQKTLHEADRMEEEDIAAIYEREEERYENSFNELLEVLRKNLPD